jgi:large subunit ribosomal protein L18
MYKRPVKYKDAREHRKVRLRFTIQGTAERPRMSVFRSARHIYIQVIDDESGKTLAAASTVEPALRAFDGDKSAAAVQVGRLAAERAIAAGITKLVFDRNGFRYTGRVAAVSQVAHEMGLLSKVGHSADGASAVDDSQNDGQE